MPPGLPPAPGKTVNNRSNLSALHRGRTYLPITTGISTYLKNGGTIEHAQQIANHESPRTTKLYDRTSDAISLDEIERILI
jgi:hypothetical protein